MIHSCSFNITFIAPIGVIFLLPRESSARVDDAQSATLLMVFYKYM